MTAGKDLGPLSALITTDVTISILLCHFLLKEYMSWMQWIAVCFSLAGMITLSLGGNEPVENSSLNNQSAESGNTGFFASLVWALMATLGFVASTWFIKLSFRQGLGAASMNLCRMVVTAICGVIVLLISLSLEVEVLEDNTHKVKMWLLMIFAGVIFSVGNVLLNVALAYKCTGVVLSIVGAGVTITVTVLSRAITNDKPSWVKILGMCIMVVAVASMPLTGRKPEDNSEANDNTHSSNHTVEEGEQATIKDTAEEIIKDKEELCFDVGMAA